MKWWGIFFLDLAPDQNPVAIFRWADQADRWLREAYCRGVYPSPRYEIRELEVAYEAVRS